MTETAVVLCGTTQNKFCMAKNMVFHSIRLPINIQVKSKKKAASSMYLYQFYY